MSTLLDTSGVHFSLHVQGESLKTGATVVARMVEQFRHTNKCRKPKLHDSRNELRVICDNFTGGKAFVK
jgi:hypothetical protein